MGSQRLKSLATNKSVSTLRPTFLNTGDRNNIKIDSVSRNEKVPANVRDMKKLGIPPTSIGPQAQCDHWPGPIYWRTGESKANDQDIQGKKVLSNCNL